MNLYNRRTLVGGAAIALLIAGVISYFASPSPDGLEKAQEELDAATPVRQAVEVPPVVFQEYNLKGLGEGFWANAAAGVTGSLLVLALLLGVGYMLCRRARPSPLSPPWERGRG
jgi:hypothetical protein